MRYFISFVATAFLYVKNKKRIFRHYSAHESSIGSVVRTFRFQVAQYGFHDHFSLHFCIVLGPQVFLENRENSIAVGYAHEAEGIDEEVEVKRVYAEAENSVAFSAFEEFSDRVDGDCIALHH